jgi:hypothetical protein
MTQSASWYPSQVGGMPPASQMRPQVEIEGDGLEGQLPPRRSANKAPDDPREPFSPNYGSVPPANSEAAPAPA